MLRQVVREGQLLQAAAMACHLTLILRGFLAHRETYSSFVIPCRFFDKAQFSSNNQMTLFPFALSSQIAGKFFLQVLKGVVNAW